MSEKFDLNKLRDEVLEAKQSEKNNIDENTGAFSINTLSRFEALPIEEQIRMMERRGYSDLELYKKKHFASGVDINELRAQIKGMADNKE